MRAESPKRTRGNPACAYAVMKLTTVQRIRRNAALKFAARLDRMRPGSKVEPAAARVDSTAPCAACPDSSGRVLSPDGEAWLECETCKGKGRVQFVKDAPKPTPKYNGVVITPRSYTKWLEAGQPAHPVFNREAWNAERYIMGVALPTCGKVVTPPPSTRHTTDCDCSICREFKGRIQRTTPPEAVQPRDWDALRVSRGGMPPVAAVIVLGEPVAYDRSVVLRPPLRKS